MGNLSSYIRARRIARILRRTAPAGELLLRVDARIVTVDVSADIARFLSDPSTAETSDAVCVTTLGELIAENGAPLSCLVESEGCQYELRWPDRALKVFTRPGDIYTTPSTKNNPANSCKLAQTQSIPPRR